MFFILSKTVAFLLLPSNFLIVFGLAGVLLMATRWKRAGLRAAATSIVLLAAAGFLPVGNLL
ncbi:MAG: YdcF family protein, partial [Pseudolabrys sp.]